MSENEFEQEELPSNDWLFDPPIAPEQQGETGERMTAAPVADFAELQPLATRPQTSWQTLVLVGLAAFMAAMWLSTVVSCERDGRDDSVDVRVDKPHVLIAWDDAAEMTDGQADVVGSTKVQTFCEENGVEYRRFDVDDDLIAVEPVWQAMMNAAGSPPAVVIATTKRAFTVPVAESVDEFIAQIQSEL